MNFLQILSRTLAAAVNDPAKISLFVQKDLNSEVANPFADVLPRDVGSSYAFEGGALNMVVTPLLPVAMNSPFPSIGSVAPNVWRGETDKYAGEIPVDELSLRRVQDTLLRQTAQVSRNAGQRTVEEFLTRLLSNLRNAADLAEKIAMAEAVMTGRYQGKAAIFGAKGQKLIGKADYGVHRVTAKTAHDKAGSTFWDDFSAAARLLAGSVQRAFISEATYVKLKANPANGIIEDARVNNADGSYTVTISRLAKTADGAFDTTSLLRDAEFAGRELTVIKTLDYQVPGPDGMLVKLSYGVDGTIALLGADRLGVLYVAPTVEGTMRGVPLDRFAYLSQPRDWEVAARCVENFVPVIEDYRNLAIIETGIKTE